MINAGELSSIKLFLSNGWRTQPTDQGILSFSDWSGKIYKGAHEPIITKEVFDDARKELEGGHKKLKATKEFAFKGIFKCYSCESGICGEEKLRKLKNGGHRRHVYYHCTRFKNRKCKEHYLDEKELIKYLINFIDGMDEDKIVIPEKLKGAMMEYQKLVSNVICYNTSRQDDIEIGVKDYVKYILHEGTNKAKRDLVEQLPIPRFLHNRSLIHKQ